MTRLERGELNILARKRGLVIYRIGTEKDANGNALYLLRKKSTKYEQLANGFQTKILGDIVLPSATKQDLINYLNN
jgi:hypothetical protein